MRDHPILSRLAEVEWPALPMQRGVSLLALLYQMDRSERWDPQQTRALQLRQMRHVLQHAVATVPYYRSRRGAYDPMLSAERAPTEAAWRDLPLLTRRDLQVAGGALHSTAVPPTHGRITETQTSGSTGQPVQVRRTGVTALFWEAITMRDHYWHARDFSARLAVIRGTDKKTAQPPDGLRLGDWGPPTNILHATGPSAMLSIAADIRTQARWLLQQDPQYVLSYPSNLAALARYFQQAGIKLPNLRELRTVGETLTDDVRLACREAWGEVPLVDAYSSQEVGYIALQCRAGRYHVQAESLLVEVLDERGHPCSPGQVGRVVVSSLHNFAMPLVRYELRDYAEVGGDCLCGRTLPVLTRILGRRRNILTLPGGEQRWPLTGFHAYRNIAPISQFQFVQRTTEDIDVRFVVERPLTADEESRLADVIRKALGHPFRLNFVYYDGEIPRTAGGKFEEFVSLLEGEPIPLAMSSAGQTQPGGDSELTAGLRFNRILSATSPLPERVAGCIRQAMGLLEGHTASTAIRKLAGLMNLTDAQQEELLAAASPVFHIGFLLPSETDEMILSEVAGETGLAISASLPSEIFSRELGVLAGRPRVETRMYRLEGISRQGRPVIIEVFVPGENPALVNGWIADDAGTHIAFRVKSPDAVRAIQRMLECCGYDVLPFMQGRPMENRERGALVIFYDLPVPPEGRKVRVEFYHER